MMSGLEVMGMYFLGLILGGLLGFMVARRLYGRAIPAARLQRLVARWGQRLRRAFRSGSPGAERSGKSQEAEEGRVGREVRPETPGSMRRVPEPDRVTEDRQSEVPQPASHPQPQQKPRWIARWLTRRRVEAEEFVVRDSTGMRRAKLGMSVDGWVRLRLFDEDGQRCVSLGVAPDGSARLRLYDQYGAPRAGLAVFPESAGEGLVLNDQAGNPRMTFSLLDDGAADLRILDAGGTVLWKAP
jgi:hypothetical protein